MCYGLLTMTAVVRKMAYNRLIDVPDGLSFYSLNFPIVNFL